MIMRLVGWKHGARAVVLIALLALWLALLPTAGAFESTPFQHESPADKSHLASSIALVPTWNATLQEAHPNTNYGGSIPLTVGRIDGGRSRALIKFNTGQIPAGATINSATLRIYQGGWYDYSGSVRTIYADRVTAPWHEAVAMWGCAPTVGDTVGHVGVGMTEGWYLIDVTSLVRDWYMGTTPNYGVLLRGYEGSASLYRQFAPRLYDEEPQLVVNYTPQPTTLGVSSNAVSFLIGDQGTGRSATVLRITNGGSDVMSWSINTGATPWLVVNPTSGSTSASYDTLVDVSVLTASLSVGTHTSQLVITAPGAQSSPQVVNVTVTVSSNPISQTHLPLTLMDAAGVPPSPGPESETVALLIGIADYQHLDPPPDSSERTGDWGYDLGYSHLPPSLLYDTEAARGGLARKDAVILTDADAYFDSVQEAAVSRIPARETGSIERAIFAYAGHGGRDVAGHYLITAYDTNMSGGNFSLAISGPTLDGWLDNWNAPQVFANIDACWSGGLLSDLSQPGRVVVTSARSDQSAWESSQFNSTVFTHFLVQALMDHAADTNGDGWVSAEEAYVYASSRTDSYVFSETGEHQNPQIYDGVTGHLRLVRAPSCLCMAAAPATTPEEVEPLGAVHFSGNLTPRPVRLRPLP
jgi:hypothetical protein